MRPAMIWLVRLVAAWQRVRSGVSQWLLRGGLALIAYGVVYWWKGLPYPAAILMTYSALGCLALGAGLSLRTPASVKTLSLSLACFVVSGVLQPLVFLFNPLNPVALLSLAAAWAGAVHTFARLRVLRAGRRG